MIGRLFKPQQRHYPLLCDAAPREYRFSWTASTRPRTGVNFSCGRGASFVSCSVICVVYSSVIGRAKRCSVGFLLPIGRLNSHGMGSKATPRHSSPALALGRIADGGISVVEVFRIDSWQGIFRQKPVEMFRCGDVYASTGPRYQSPWSLCRKGYTKTWGRHVPIVYIVDRQHLCAWTWCPSMATGRGGYLTPAGVVEGDLGSTLTAWHGSRQAGPPSNGRLRLRYALQSIHAGYKEGRWGDCRKPHLPLPLYLD